MKYSYCNYLEDFVEESGSDIEVRHDFKDLSNLNTWMHKKRNTLRGWENRGKKEKRETVKYD